MNKSNLNPESFLQIEELSAIENKTLQGGRNKHRDMLRNPVKCKRKGGCD